METCCSWYQIIALEQDYTVEGWNPAADSILRVQLLESESVPARPKYTVLLAKLPYLWEKMAVRRNRYNGEVVAFFNSDNSLNKDLCEEREGNVNRLCGDARELF